MEVSPAVNHNELSEMVTAALTKKALHSSDIPAIDLYLDQILTLVADKAESGAKGSYLTKTMINNYSKDGLLKPLKGKKYTKEHIVQIMIIYYMKGILSIGDIKRVFDGIYSDPNFSGEDLIKSYDRFLNMRSKEEELCRNVIEFVTEKAELDPEKADEFLIILMSLVSFCDALKSTALELISAKYRQEESSEKQKDKKNRKSAEKKQGKDNE